jgi:hypothetical protein
MLLGTFVGCTVENSSPLGAADAPVDGAHDDHGATDEGDHERNHDAAAIDTAHALTALPAKVCEVLQRNRCLTCHEGHGHGGAPMSLQRASDFAAKALDGTPMGQKVLDRMRDPARPMPPPAMGLPSPSEADLKVVNDWVARGAHGVEGQPCEQTTASAPSGPEWASAAWPEDQCEQVITIGAHEQNGMPFADDPAGFPVPADETYYHCFYEKMPWADKPMQALAIRAHVDTPDDMALLHHMQLSSLGANDGVSMFGAPRPTRGGQHNPCANPNGSTVGTWGPGALNPVTVPDDVGVLMPAGKNAYLELQVHYHNPKHEPEKRSRTRFDVCVTSKLRPNTAAVHTLGYENSFEGAFNVMLGGELPPLDNRGNGVARGVCTAKERTRVLSIAPHMHELGRHSKVEVVRRDGSVQVLHDMAFDFNNQTSYLFDDLWLERGDKIRTTCVWDSTQRPIVFGFSSKDEMCFVSTLAYPAGGLSGKGDEKGWAGGTMSCAGLGD